MLGCPHMLSMSCLDMLSTDCPHMLSTDCPHILSTDCPHNYVVHGLSSYVVHGLSSYVVHGLSSYVVHRLFSYMLSIGCPHMLSMGFPHMLSMGCPHMLSTGCLLRVCFVFVLVSSCVELSRTNKPVYSPDGARYTRIRMVLGFYYRVRLSWARWGITSHTNFSQHKHGKHMNRHWQSRNQANLEFWI